MVLYFIFLYCYNRDMKKFIVIIVTTLIIGLVSMSGFSANAAVVKKYNVSTEKIADDDNGSNEQIPAVDNSEDDSLPSKYSSAELGYTSTVKSQIGDTCWAYSSMSTYESLLLKNGLFYGDFGVDGLDLWGSNRSDGTGWQRDVRNGGYTSISVGYFTSWNGPLTYEDETPRFGANGVRFYNSGDRSEIKKAIMRTGAVTANLNYNSTGRSLDRNSFYIDNSVTYISGHSVSIVGWDDNYSKDNFTGSYKPLNDGAWLCKNSWGEYDSNIGGYLWISYEDYYFLNSEYFDEGFSIENFQEIKEDDHIYQNEEFGATYEFENSDDYKQTFFNVFDFSKNGNVLDKVTFETLTVGADYSVYYVPLNSEEKPVQDRSKWTKLSSGTVDYRGYICADFDDFVISRNKAAIAVELDNERNRSGCTIGVCEWLRSDITQEMIFINSSRRGDSFIEYNGQIIDVMDYYLEAYNDEIGGTFVIKAITDKTTITNIKGDVNLDEKININDVTLIQQYLVGLGKTFYADHITNADFNCDGVININDATAIQIRLATGQ